MHNYSNYQCCQHIRVTESWKMRSHNRSQVVYSKLIHLSLPRVYWSVSNWIFDTINISWHCLIFYLSAFIGNVSLLTRVRGIIWHITQMGNATTVYYLFMLRLGTRFQFAKRFCLLVTLSEAHGWTPHLLRNVCNQRRSEQEYPLSRIIFCNLLFKVLLNFAHNAQTCSPIIILWKNNW